MSLACCVVPLNRPGLVTCKVAKEGMWAAHHHTYLPVQPKLRCPGRLASLWSSGDLHILFYSLPTELSFLPDSLPPGCRLQGDDSWRRRSVHLPETFLCVQQRSGWGEPGANCPVSSSYREGDFLFPPFLLLLSPPSHLIVSGHTRRKEEPHIPQLCSSL